MDKNPNPIPSALHRKKATPKLKRGSGSVHSSVAEAIGMRIVRGEFPPEASCPTRRNGPPISR